MAERAPYGPGEGCEDMEARARVKVRVGGRGRVGARAGVRARAK